MYVCLSVCLFGCSIITYEPVIKIRMSLQTEINVTWDWNMNLFSIIVHLIEELVNEMNKNVQKCFKKFVFLILWCQMKLRGATMSQSPTNELCWAMLCQGLQLQGVVDDFYREFQISKSKRKYSRDR